MTALLLSFLLVMGTVEGRVVSSADGRGVAEAVVAVDSLGLSAHTDRDGAFRLEGLEAGRWVLRISAPGFRDRTLAVRVPRTGSITLEVELEPDPSLASEVGEGTLRGTILEEERLVPVSGAEVILVEPGLRARSDAAGRFRLGEVPAGTWTLRLSAPGYRRVDRAVRVPAGGTEALVVALEPSPFPLQGVEVLRRRRLGDLVVGGRGPLRVVDSTRVDLLPVAVERDVFRAIQTLPSVTPSSDFSSALYVRGGTPDQTRLLLDGAPVHNPFHLGGFVSAFVPSATEGVVLRPGAVPASVPSSLAGTMEIHTVRGARDSVRVHGSAGLLSSSLAADGPLPAGRGTFLVSARRTYVDAVSAAAEAVGLIDTPFPYGFTDALARATVDVGSEASLSTLGYVDLEGLRDAGPGEVEALDASWRSAVLSVRGEGPLGEHLRVQGGAAISGFGAGVRRETRRLGSMDAVGSDTSRADLSLRTLALDARAVAALGDHALSAGVRWERDAVDHGIADRSLDETYVPELAVDGRYGGTALFLRDRWEPGSGASLDAGLRVERPRGRGWWLLPRLRVARRLTPELTVGLGGGRYVQDWWSLRDEESAYTGVVAYDVTVPVPDAHPLPTGWDVVADARVELGRWHVRLDAFHKELRDVPTPTPRRDPVDGPILLHPDSVETGRATVRGLELAGAGGWGQASLAVSYRWQQEERTVGGLRFTPRSERRHRLVVAGTRPWGEREVALGLTWMSGASFTPSELTVPWVTEVGPDGRPVPTRKAPDARVVYGAPNGDRLPSYLRLDLSARGNWDLSLFGRHGVLEPYVSVLNVLNRHNALAVEHDADGSRVLKRLGPQLPVLPSFGVRWRF